jgi:plastocyanin
VRLRRRIAFGAVAALGAATAVLPALAGSETIPAVEAVNVGGGIYGEEHHWSPGQVTIGVGGSVKLSNATAVPHGVEWRSAVKPSCEEGAGKVPVGNTVTASGTSWSGSCTFSQPGSYTFYCTVHGAAMSATITVTPTTSATTGTTTGGEPPPGSTTVTAPEAPLLAPPFAALKLPGHQRGGLVYGSLAISSTAAGGRLEIDLLARQSSLGKGGHAFATRVRVGRLIRTSLLTGPMRFGVSLDQRARRALQRHRRLTLTVRIVITPIHGQAVTLTRSVVEGR